MIVKSEVFERAAEIVEEHGWRQGSLGGGSSNIIGPVCILGACAVAMSEAYPDWLIREDGDRTRDPYNELAEMSFYRTLNAVGVGHAGSPPWAWNDELLRTRTRDEAKRLVIDKLKEAVVVSKKNENIEDRINANG